MTQSILIWQVNSVSCPRCLVGGCYAIALGWRWGGGRNRTRMVAIFLTCVIRQRLRYVLLVNHGIAALGGMGLLVNERRAC